MKFTVYRLILQKATYQIFVKIGPVVFEKVLTNGERHTMDENL